MLLGGRAAKSGEYLAPDRIVPVSECVSDRARTCSPRSAAENLVIGAEELLRVLRIRECLETGMSAKVGGRPFPYVADHSVASQGRDILLVSQNRSGGEHKLIHVRESCGYRSIAPRVVMRGPGRRAPRCRYFPLVLGRKALARPPRKCFRLVIAHVADRLRQIDGFRHIHVSRRPPFARSSPVLRRLGA